MSWLTNDYKNTIKKRPYFWIADAKMDVELEKKRKKNTSYFFRKLAIVGILFMFLIYYFIFLVPKIGSHNNLVDFDTAYREFIEIGNRAFNASNTLNADAGNVELVNKNENMEDFFKQYRPAFFFLSTMAVIDNSASYAESGLDYYDSYIYRELSSYEQINKKLLKRANELALISHRDGRKDFISVADNTQAISTYFEIDRLRLKELYEIQLGILKVIAGKKNKKDIADMYKEYDRSNELVIELEWARKNMEEASDKAYKNYKEVTKELAIE